MRELRITADRRHPWEVNQDKQEGPEEKVRCDTGTPTSSSRQKVNNQE